MDISIIIPCHNEEEFIGKCLDSIVEQDYSKDRLEVLVVDGLSDDGTREILKNYTNKYPFIKLLDNPKVIIPAALNIGIGQSSGEVIIRLDAHAAYRRDYMKKCKELLAKYNVDVMGGVIVTLPRNNTILGKAIAISLSHPFGVGNSYFRIGSKKPRRVDTVFNPCYRRSMLDKVGLFNEKIMLSEDITYNQKIKAAGGKILLTPELVSYYYVFSDFRSFCKHNFRNGFWSVYPFKFSVKPVSFRHLVPLGLVLGLFIVSLLSLFFPALWQIFLSIIAVYFITNFCFSIYIAAKRRDARLIFLMPIIFTSLHFAYGLGSVKALITLSMKK